VNIDDVKDNKIKRSSIRLLGLVLLPLSTLFFLLIFDLIMVMEKTTPLQPIVSLKKNVFLFERA